MSEHELNGFAVYYKVISHFSECDTKVSRPTSLKLCLIDMENFHRGFSSTVLSLQTHSFSTLFILNLWKKNTDNLIEEPFLMVTNAYVFNIILLYTEWPTVFIDITILRVTFVRFVAEHG